MLRAERQKRKDLLSTTQSETFSLNMLVSHVSPEEFAFFIITSLPFFLLDSHMKDMIQRMVLGTEDIKF